MRVSLVLDLMNRLGGNILLPVDMFSSESEAEADCADEMR